jgi:hypothetical protein
MSDNVIQSSFASGELSPSLSARVDIAKYHAGAATMRNFFVDYRSGASTRPGTEYIRPTPGGIIRLVRFQQSVDVTFVLEFGNQYLRFISGGASIIEDGFDINVVSNGAPTFVEAVGNNFNDGDLLFISGVFGMPQINGRYFIPTGNDGTGFFLLDPITGAAVDSTNWPVYVTAGTVSRVYQIDTPYADTELSTLKFSQKASVMNITSPNHPPYTLTLISATNWVLEPVVIGSTAPVPTGLFAVATATTPDTSSYYLIEVTSVDANNQESAAASFNLDAVLDIRVTQGTISVGWDIMPNAVSYNVYFSSPSLAGTVEPDTAVGFVGSTNTNVFNNSNVAPDFGQVPPIAENPFDPAGPDPNPQVSSYFQQRLVYANGGGNDVDEFWMSRPGAYSNFDISNPSQDDDSLTGKLVSLEVNEIKSLVPMPSGLITLTTKGAWQISGGAGGVATQGGPVTPSTLTATPQAYIGANDVPPILINYDILFVQQKGSIIRNMAYNIYANIYTGNDISILSSHLFYGHQIKEWAYAEEPFKIVWAVRDDGVLLSLTILKEQDMYGWARHDTRGNFLSVCTVTEGPVDATYFVVDRPSPAGAGFARGIERLADRSFQFGADDAWCVDCGLQTVPNEPDATLTPFGSTGDIGFSADSPVFDITMLGWVIRAGGGIATVTSVVDSQTVGAHVTKPITNIIPNDPLGRINSSPPGTWSIDPPFTQVFGLDHLEGQPVSVLADGGVVKGLTVTNGSITLPAPASKIVVGYGFQAQLQTMYLDLGQETNSIQGKRKKVNALTIRVKDTRGLKAGRTFNSLIPIKELNRVTTLDLPIQLITGDERIVMDPLWDVPGQICLQVDDPLPATVLGVIPEITLGDTSK